MTNVVEISYDGIHTPFEIGESVIVMDCGIKLCANPIPFREMNIRIGHSNKGISVACIRSECNLIPVRVFSPDDPNEDAVMVTNGLHFILKSNISNHNIFVKRAFDKRG